jgi:hypothetical protein
MNFIVRLLRPLLLLSALGCITVLPAQEDDTVELSSFYVTSESDRSYASTTPKKPDVAISLRKPATSVVMEVTLLNSADKPDARNREIYATIKDIQQAVQNAGGLRFERREIQLRGDARRKTLFSRSGTTSYANVAVVAPLAPGADLFALVQRMRTVVSGVAPVGATKIVDGTAGLILEKPEQYRQELLKAIFADVAFVRSGLGEGFEVLLSGLDGAINVRAASETEVELWIDYSFTIRSVLELQHPAPLPMAARR